MIPVRLSVENATIRDRKVPTRAELAVEDTWDLSHLYREVSEWEKDFQDYQKSFPELNQFKGRLRESAAVLKECLELNRRLDRQAEHLHHFAMLQNAEDASNNDYLTRMGALQIALSHAAESAAWLTPELLSIPDETWNEWLESPELAEWRNWLKKVRRFRPHVLSEAEERIMALVAAPLGGMDEAFSQLTNVDMKFGRLRDEHGQEVELSHGAFSSFLNKRDRGLRKQAFDQYYEEFSDHRFTLAATLAHSVKADVFRARARHFNSAREAALFPDDVPISVYDHLITAVRHRIDAISRYYRLRKKVLQLDEVHVYDLYVPIVPAIEWHAPIQKAEQMVLDALEPLGDEYVSTLRQGFASRWVDRYESKGKRSGAFSSHSYGCPPYILMNYKEDVFADVYTLAHEAGHSMHSWFSMRNQPFQDYQYPIFLAEVASTFNEELLTHHLLETSQDTRFRAFVINRQLDDIRATLIRQTMFAEFEKIIHELEEQGEALTLDRFRQVYRELLIAYHGPEFFIDDALELECLRIPHFYSAFYVYKYATGLSAALALSKRVLTGEAGAKEAYLGFLQSGGSDKPIEILKRAGVDMTSTRPVEDALDLFVDRLKELENLLEP